MYNYEANPPVGTWDKIAAALDEHSSENEFPSRLYDMEVTPPASAWETINASLDEQKEKVVPLHKRRTVFFRYAAAAAFIGLAVLGVIRLTNISGKSEETTITGTAQGEPAKNVEPLSNGDNSNSVTTNSETVNIPHNGSPEKNEPVSYTQKKVPVKYSSINVSRSVASATSSNDYYSSNDPGNNSLYAYEDHTQDISNRYIMLMTPDGNIIRMSKKWSDLVCCVSGEEQDEDCKTQLKQWQKKIATSPISTSSGNFLDLLDLVSSLEDGTDM